jgi:hypothetical protein
MNQNRGRAGLGQCTFCLENAKVVFPGADRQGGVLVILIPECAASLIRDAGICHHPHAASSSKLQGGDDPGLCIQMPEKCRISIF